ncbi:CcdB family protein [Castellaniella sp.]|uniref:CcdB family protein n=1 Tax=Castellaniella sp. TaxID=1955812 RepID=UPI002AFF05A6|nr:CcdB family protein [Castellaniella sp.]
MPRFDVYANPGGVGYVLDVQADVLEALNTRIVVPLMPANAAPAPAKRLNPIFRIEAEPYVMVTQFMAAIPRAHLRSPITNLAQHDSEIMAAIDLALVGF